MIKYEYLYIHIHTLCTGRALVDAKVSWEGLSIPKTEGGLGLRNIMHWNETCILKLLWMIFFRSGSLWVAWIRNKYISSSSFWALNEKNYSYSWMFRKILGMRPKALPFLKISVKNGESTFFWWDPWTPFGPLFTYLASDGPSLMGIPIDATVADLRTTSGWLLPNARSDKQLLLFSYISSLQLHDGSDVACWSVEDVPSKSFKAKIVFNAIRTQRQRKAWAPLIWHNAVIPRHNKTAWLFTLNRNPTFDRIASWSSDVETVCLLCGNSNESRDHLFSHALSPLLYGTLSCLDSA